MWHDSRQGFYTAFPREVRRVAADKRMKKLPGVLRGIDSLECSADDSGT